MDKSKELGVKVKKGVPDLRLQDGMVIDDIKELSTKVAVNTFEMNKFTVGQMYFFVHFLMNELGFNYEEELDIYLSLAHNVRFERRS